MRHWWLSFEAHQAVLLLYHLLCVDPAAIDLAAAGLLVLVFVEEQLAR